jgi:hypothetical protein
VKLGVLDKTRNPAREAVMGNRAGDASFHAFPDQDLIIVRRHGAAPVKIHAGGRPQCPAAGPGNSVWFLLPGQDALIAFPDPGSLSVHRLPPRPGLPPRGLASLALGPDGNLWFTQKEAGRIGRMTPEGEFTEFPLAPGHSPVAIIRGHDGRMLFTLEGQDLIGSIRAVAEPGGKEPSAASAAEAAASWVAAVPVRMPEKKKAWTSAQRHARMDAWYQEAERRALERKRFEQPEPKPAQDWFWTQGRISAALAAEGPVPAGSAPEPGGEPPAADRPLDVLAEVDATLPPTALEHILERHAMGGMPHKSQFAKEFSTPEGILALIARHLPGAWAGAEDYTCDEMGRTVTFCRQEGVGWYNVHGALIPTSRFAVVTEHVHTEQGLRHAVVTAYPVTATG